jgi:hypothetical protein
MPESNDFAIGTGLNLDPKAGIRTEYGEGPKLSIQSGFERIPSKANQFNLDEPDEFSKPKSDDDEFGDVPF